MGVIVDINTSEITLAIFFSRESEPFPKLLWQHKELTTFTSKDANTELKVRAAIQRGFAALSNSGLAALRKQNIRNLPEIIQVSISAPLSYTIARNMKVSSAEPFKVTSSLLRELESKATNEAKSFSTSSLMAKDLNLTTLSNSTAGLSINGYQTYFPLKSTATEVLLCQVVTLSSKELVTELEGQRDKVLPKARLDIDSFMSVYLRSLVTLSPKTSDACLINLTDEYVEMLLLRDSLPQSSTFSKVTICQPNSSNAAYQQDLTAMFKSAGDGLAMPRQIFTHTKRSSDQTLKPCLEEASKSATGINHQVSLTGTQFFTNDAMIPPNLACLAYVFHKDLYEDRSLEEYRNMLK